MSYQLDDSTRFFEMLKQKPQNYNKISKKRNIKTNFFYYRIQQIPHKIYNLRYLPDFIYSLLLFSSAFMKYGRTSL